MRLLALLGTLVMALLVTGCSSEGSGPPGDSSDGKPVGAETPEGTLLELIKRIAAEDGTGACGLFLPGGAAIFARNYEATNCPGAMDIVIGQVTDPKGFAAYTLKPSGEYPGVQIRGDAAGFGGPCTGWTGSRVTSGITPGRLGYFGLKRTDDGWLINDHRPPTDSCGG